MKKFPCIPFLLWINCNNWIHTLLLWCCLPCRMCFVWVYNYQNMQRQKISKDVNQKQIQNIFMVRKDSHTYTKLFRIKDLFDYNQMKTLNGFSKISLEYFLLPRFFIRGLNFNMAPCTVLKLMSN